MQEPKLFLPKKGNYQDLASYKKATVIYDLTFYFAKHFLVKGDRTIDQMVQAARSGKQNIAEGCAAAATSAETELKLVNVARASMKELLVDYEDYLRVRNLQMWTFDDNRTQKTREFCKKHDLSKDFMHDIDRRSDEAIANITITLLHQFDNIIGAYIAHLEKTFVEQGGIRERMTAARLGYRNSQQARIAELEQENRSLKAHIAELEQKLKGLIGHIGLIGLIGLIGHIGLIGPISLISLALSACGGGDAVPQLPQQPTNIQQPITFSGTENREQTVTRADGTPLSATVERFQVWGHKNMSYNSGTDEYYDRQTVFQGYQVDWTANTAATSATNTNGWEYILTEKPNQTIKFWDWSAEAYRFFAVTNWEEERTEPDEDNKAYGAYKAYEAYGPYMPYEAYEISMKVNANSTNEAPYFSRLWFSTGDPTAYPDKQFGRPVTLEFIKPFARVRFQFIYATPREGITLTNKSFLPSDNSKIYKKAKVTISYPMTGKDIKEAFSAETIATADSTYISEDYDPENDLKEYPDEAQEGWYTVVPNTKQGSYTLKVTVNGAGKTAVVPATYMQWLPGYSYTYVFKITDEGGVAIGWVDYAVTPWIEAPATHEVYNW